MSSWVSSARRPSSGKRGITSLAVAAVLISMAIASPVAGLTAKKAAEKIKGEAGANFTQKGVGYIRLAYKAFDPLKGEPSVAKNLRAVTKPGVINWWLVQLSYPIRKPARDAVLAAGSRFGGFIPDGTYIMEMTPEQAAKARQIAGVRWVGLYQPAYKLRSRYAGSPGVLDVAGPRDFRAWLFRGQDKFNTIARIAGIPGVTVDRDHSTSNVIPLS